METRTTTTTLINLTKKAARAADAYRRETGIARETVVARAIAMFGSERTIRAGDIRAAFDAIIAEDKAAEPLPPCPFLLRSFLVWAESAGYRLIESLDMNRNTALWVILDRDLDRLWSDYQRDQAV